MSTIAEARFAGSAYDIGRQLGAFRADALRDLLPRIERFRSLQARWQASDRLRTMAALAREAFPQVMREIDGIADGAGLPFEDIFLWNCRGDLPETDPDAGQEGAIGCTTILARDPESGRRIIAHNEDGHALLDGHCAFVHLEPDDGLPVSAFHYPGLIAGHNFGFNAAGLVLTVNHIRPHNLPVGLPRHVISRAALGAPDIDAALALFRREDRAGGFHYALAQAGDDRLLSVEAPGSGCVATDIADAAAHANHLLDPAFADEAQTVSPSSERRQAQASAALDSAGRNGATAQAILADRRNRDYPVCLKGGHRDASSFTLASALFEIGDEALDWQVHTDPADPPVLKGRVPAARIDDAAG